jgi:hypothetical protein
MSCGVPTRQLQVHRCPPKLAIYTLSLLTVVGMALRSYLYFS